MEVSFLLKILQRESRQLSLSQLLREKYCTHTRSKDSNLKKTFLQQQQFHLTINTVHYLQKAQEKVLATFDTCIWRLCAGLE